MVAKCKVCTHSSNGSRPAKKLARLARHLFPRAAGAKQDGFEQSPTKLELPCRDVPASSSTSSQNTWASRRHAERNSEMDEPVRLS
mmetsp:Transcript_47551/g.102495  ORF Transcript_47551/g.102495 Transcript_47551/m.102495 type:complete len:86 (-) Transcript_47551:65-322(-)